MALPKPRDWSDRGGELRFPRPELSPSSYSRGLSAQGSDVCLDSRGEQSLDLVSTLVSLCSGPWTP
ncbi:hypothetical protein KIL84_010164 [Mauremys mutica]|uniref:Uncharacterized protein n=1 Tax=Mauremys mutica TaxID=74926 RepID=A0A9D3XNL9_9SAUR|nr:hypothetical protein KIL84_010164 [Mauremys mutica]